MKLGANRVDGLELWEERMDGGGTEQASPCLTVLLISQWD